MMGTIVELEGTLLESLSAAQPKLVLQDGSIIFSAQVALVGFCESMPNFIVGSQVG